MANALYGKGRQAFADGSIDWVNDTIKVTLVDSADYVVSIDVDDFYDDVTAAGRVATATLANATNPLGVCDADNVTFSAVSGDVCEALVIWKDTAGGESTDPLIAYIDTATGLPATPNGSDINVTWSAGANRIFKL